MHKHSFNVPTVTVHTRAQSTLSTHTHTWQTPPAQLPSAIMPYFDFDWWTEFLIKTRRDRFDALRDAIVDLHPYELPEVIAVAVDTGLAGR